MQLSNVKIYNAGYDYKSVYKFVEENKIASSTYSVGLTYGVFTELLNNYLVKEYRNAKKTYESVNNSNITKGIAWASADPDIIDSNKQIDFLIIGYMIPDKNKFIKKMLKKDWKVKKKFYSKTYESTVFLLQR